MYSIMYNVFVQRLLFIFVQWDCSHVTLDCVHVTFLSLLAWKVGSWVFVNTFMSSGNKTSCLTTTFLKIPASLSFSRMFCCLNCVPVCCRRQEFSHPFVEDPEREDNFVQVDTRPPLAIYIDRLYNSLIVTWTDIWDNPN